MLSMRGLYVAYATAAAALVAVASSHDFTRDARLDWSLVELLASPAVDERDEIDAAIEQMLAHCRLHGVSGVVPSLPHADASSDVTEVDSESESALAPSDVAFCHRVRFVRHARQRLRTIHTQRATRHDRKDRDHTPIDRSVGVRRADNLDYQTFFETFAERPTPLVVTQTPPLLEGEDDDASFWTACFKPHKHKAPLRVHDAACAPWLDRFHVPLLSVNNFIPRTSVSTSAALLPALLTVTASVADATCPFGLHSVFVSVAGAVEFQLYDAPLLPLQLPIQDDDGDDDAFNEVTVAADATARDKLRLFSGGAASLVDPPAFTSLLDEGQTLFVPGGKYAVALRDTAAQVLRVCFVDASNLNGVTETLRVDALVSGLAKRLFLALQTPAFDAAMTRRPSSSDDTLWANYMQWPKETKLLKRRDMVSTDTHAPVPMSRRERLKLWQDDKRWARHVASLTLPVPLPPVVINATRRGVVLRWQDLHARPKHDITPFGYEVHWRQETLNEDATAVGAVNFTHTQLVRSAMPTTLFGDAFDGKDIEGIVTGLVPDAVYSFTIRLYVGTTFGVMSERSRSVGTSSCAVPSRVPGVVIRATAKNAGSCLHVRWLQPTDDGGRRITSYVFALRYVQSRPQQVGVVDPEQLRDDERLTILQTPSSSSSSSSSSSTTTKAASSSTAVWLSGAVCDQVPGRVRVRVAAVNAMGMSAWSMLSAPMTMGDDQPRRVPIVRGRGDPAFVASPPHLVSNATSARPRVVLSDMQQQLIVATARIDVWTGHFSPQRFDVSSELVLAEPLDASLPLRNAADVRDRVVVVARGHVPFLFKLRHAQHAGALGVVFADVQGRCTRGFDQSCVAGASKRQGQGFGAGDRHPLWREIRIPFVLALPEPSAALLELLSP